MLLITAEEVITHAFTLREQITTRSIRPLKIDIAQERYIRPRFGNEFFDQMCQGKFADFVERYIKPALAQYVRYAMVEELSVQLNENGAIIYGKTDVVMDASTSRDGSEGLTRTTVDQLESTTTNKGTNTQTEKTTQSNQTDKENYVDMSIANYPQENSSELATIKRDLTQSESIDTMVDRNDQKSVTDKSQTTIKNTDMSNQNKISETYRVATLVERRIIAAQALSDANVLLAKAVRYVERNEDQFEFYLPMAVSARVFF